MYLWFRRTYNNRHVTPLHSKMNQAGHHRSVRPESLDRLHLWQIVPPHSEDIVNLLIHGQWSCTFQDHLMLISMKMPWPVLEVYVCVGSTSRTSPNEMEWFVGSISHMSRYKDYLPELLLISETPRKKYVWSRHLCLLAARASTVVHQWDWVEILRYMTVVPRLPLWAFSSPL